MRSVWGRKVSQRDLPDAEVIAEFLLNLFLLRVTAKVTVMKAKSSYSVTSVLSVSPTIK